MVSAADQAFRRLRCVYCYRSGRPLLLGRETGFQQMMIWGSNFRQPHILRPTNEILHIKMSFCDAGMEKDYSHMRQVEFLVGMACWVRLSPDPVPCSAASMSPRACRIWQRQPPLSWLGC